MPAAFLHKGKRSIYEAMVMETAPPDICENDKVFTCAVVTVDIGVSYAKGKLFKGCIFHDSCLEVVKLK